MSAPLLAVDDLTIARRGSPTALPIVDRISFELRGGEVLGLVGESGSGKSLTCRAIMRLLPSSLGIAGGSVRLDGRDLTTLPEANMRHVRGREIGMVFQNAGSHLDPVMRIGAQITESLAMHQPIGRQAARAEAVEVLRQVGIPDPASRVDSYPHEFSGGMRQRAMIALALTTSPKILIADEPTTALDVTVQAQILRLLLDLRDSRGLSIILITHDLGVVAQTCDSVAVLYGGRICERGPKRRLLAAPVHPYTAGLISCHPAAAGTGLLDTIAGQPPSAGAMPSGCRFHPRCPNAIQVCLSLQPPLRLFETARVAACHNPMTVAAAGMIEPDHAASRYAS